ncbi:hypothetical protein Vadar_007070 [Vaccinium darrowii]|uniref:Uncharacterized protein n=1 Tax=Vaccinium darrowii TaxID=229202 RepID=A0ACB7XNU2_9ERIC|nr:hypothetical protein Vadar_007070 [Vaccinium darrowii]
MSPNNPNRSAPRGFVWLNMVDEMGNKNVSGLNGMILKHIQCFAWFGSLVSSSLIRETTENESANEEGEKREGEARENLSQQANHGGDVRGENQINQEGEQGKDFHGKVEGLSSDNKPEGGDPPVAEQTLDDKEELPIELNDESLQDSIIQAAASPADVKETEPNLEENLLVTSYDNQIKKQKSSRRAEEVKASNSISDTGSELLGTSITDDQQETETIQEANSLGTSSNTFEEIPQTREKCMLLTGNMDKMDITENEDTKQAVNETNTDEVDSSQSELVMVSSDTGNGKENVENREFTEMTPAMETVQTELPTTECNNEEEEPEEKVIEAIEEKDEKNQELDTGILPSAGNGTEDSGGVQLRKSPSFVFDNSMEARPEESDQTPLLHHKKTHTRSPSIFNGDPIQNQVVPAEEKTIKVERSDSDKSRAPFQNLLKKDEEKANVKVKPKEQDNEKKGVEEPLTGATKEVEVTNANGKPKPRRVEDNKKAFKESLINQVVELLINDKVFPIRVVEEPVVANGYMNMMCHCKDRSSARTDSPSSFEEQSDSEKGDNVGNALMVCNKGVSFDMPKKDLIGETIALREDVKSNNLSLPFVEDDRNHTNEVVVEPNEAFLGAAAALVDDDHHSQDPENVLLVEHHIVEEPDDINSVDSSLKVNSVVSNSFVVDSNSPLEDEEASDSTFDTESELTGVSIIDDRQETETKKEVENEFGNKCGEDARTEVNLSKNGSSKPAQGASSLGTSSNTFEQVPQPQDKSMILNEHKRSVEESNQIPLLHHKKT